MTPGICANWRSSGCATEEAIVSGLAPGSWRRDLDGRKIDLQRRDRQARSRTTSTGYMMKGAEMLAMSIDLHGRRAGGRSLPAMEFGSSPWRISTGVPGCRR